ncbi:hypothetical protein MRX96_009749 [Rhipicephalus microplus]
MDTLARAVTTMMGSERIKEVDVVPVLYLALSCMIFQIIDAVVAAAYIIPRSELSGSLSSAPNPATVLPSVSQRGVPVLYQAIAAGDILKSSLLCTATPASSFFACDVHTCKVGSINKSDTCVGSYSLTSRSTIKTTLRQAVQ